MSKPIKITYIGGGSRLWARSLMSDLALEKDLFGEVVLYDIDVEAAQNNAIIGNKMMKLKEAQGHWTFSVESNLELAVQGADFIFLSILPATFEEMDAYVHIPEAYGIYQPVGDTAGPAGIFRSLIMMPIYEQFALAIKNFAKDAWVVNFTNPMTMCVQILYHVFPKIKAFGNCHEVFHVQDLLARALFEEHQIKASRKEISINPLGINHFTWINYASYKDLDLLPIYHKFAQKYHQTGSEGDAWVDYYPFGSANRVKFDLYLKYHAIAAAGDRHLVEFLPQHFYTKNPDVIKSWRYFLTPVAHRKNIKAEGNRLALQMINDETDVTIKPSGEEGVLQLKALLGLNDLITNVNMPNQGQISNLPFGHVVETNALFRRDEVRPVFAGPMPDFAHQVTVRHIKNHQLLLKAFDEKDLSYARLAFSLDPSIEHLEEHKKKALFDEIYEKVKPYLEYYTT